MPLELPMGAHGRSYCKRTGEVENAVRMDVRYI